MISNFVLKTTLDEKKILQILFYIFPIIMLTRSGYITTYVSLLTAYSLYYFYKKKIQIKIFLLDYLVFIFLLLSIISTLVNIETLGNYIFIKSILDIRFGLLYLIIRNLFYQKLVNFFPIILITSICTIFLSVDIFIQHIYQRDLFGYEPLYDRYAGIFDDEAIAGGYIQKFSFVSIPIILFIKRSNLIKIFIVTIVINILGLGILMSTDRMPFFIYILGLILLIFFSKNFRFIYLINLILLLFLSTLIFQNNSIINKRYSFIYTIEKQLYNVKSEIKNLDNYEKNSKQEIDENINSIFDDEYFKIFYTGYNLWKNNLVIGTGVKSFNLICAEEYKKNVKLVCAPHAHNLYLEIIINTGILGFLIFIFYIINILKHTKQIFFYKENNIYLYLLIILICEFFPFRSYGSIIQTVNGSLFWYLLALTSLINFPRKIK